MSERRLSILSRGKFGGLSGVELNGVKVPRVCAVSFSYDAEDSEIEAALVFRVDAVDLIEAVEALATDAQPEPDA